MLLDELKNEIALWHLDVFSRRALALTCKTYWDRWWQVPLFVDRRARSMYTLGRFGTWSYITCFLRAKTHYWNDLQHGTYDPPTDDWFFKWIFSLIDGIYKGLVREGRDDLVHALLSYPWTHEKSEQVRATECDMIHAAYEHYRNMDEHETFIGRAAALLPGDYEQRLVRIGTSGNLRYAKAIGADVYIVPLLHAVNELTFGDDPPVPLPWECLVEGPDKAGWLMRIHPLDFTAIYARETSNIIVNAHSWIRLWPYLMPLQHDQIRDLVRLVLSKSLYIWTYVHQLIDVFGTINVPTYSIFDRIAQSLYIVQFYLSWTDPMLHTLLEMYWRAGYLDISYYSDSAFVSLSESIAHSVCSAHPLDTQRTVQWFMTHSFPGSARIVQCIRACIE